MPAASASGTGPERSLLPCRARAGRPGCCGGWHPKDHPVGRPLSARRTRHDPRPNRRGEDVRGSVLRVDDGGLRGDGLAAGVGRALWRRCSECSRTNPRTGDPHGAGGRDADARPIRCGARAAARSPRHGLGLAGAVSLSRLLRRFLFEVSPLDPSAYVVAAALLVAAAMAACYLPARRVTRVDPIVALRAE